MSQAKTAQLFSKLCDCGCGLPAPIAKCTSRKRGQVKGQPMRFRQGHGGIRHGMSRTSEYDIFLGAKARCRNPKDALFKYYGGRGIEFLFDNFTQFMLELGPRPTPNHSLDRIKNHLHYAPGNVRWATKSEQKLNQRGCCAIHGPFSCPHCKEEEE